MVKQQLQSFNYDRYEQTIMAASSFDSRFERQSLWRPERTLVIEILKPGVQVATCDIAFREMLRRREMNIVFFTHTWALTLSVQRQVRVN